MQHNPELIPQTQHTSLSVTEIAQAASLNLSKEKNDSLVTLKVPSSIKQNTEQILKANGTNMSEFLRYCMVALVNDQQA